jgi:hypothetical protein
MSRSADPAPPLSLTSITYFAGASAAAIAGLLKSITSAFVISLLIIVTVFTHRTFENVETSRQL